LSTAPLTPAELAANPAATPIEIAATIQPVIAALEAVTPPVKVAGAKSWFKRYLKGEIALVGSVATLALAYFPEGGNWAHWASVIVTAVTIIGVVEASNGL
jgi:hypothetical protein